MKLHLPTRLRAAVMACLAAVASLSPTVATGVVGGGALVFALAGQQVEAAALSNRTFEYTSGDQTYTFSGGMLVTCDVSNSENAKAGGDSHSLAGVSNITVTINGTDFLMSSSTSLLNNTGVNDANMDYVIWRDFCSNQQQCYYGQTMLVKGAAEGETWSITPDYYPITFGGLISEGEGSYAVGRSSSAMQLWGNATSGANLLINAKTTLTCNALTVKTSGTWTVNDSLSVGSATTVEANVAITLAGTGPTSLTGLSMAAGSSLTIGTGSALTLGGTLNLLGTVTNSGTLTLASTVVFDLSGLTATQNEDGSYSYSLFTNAEGGTITGLDTVTADNITGIITSGREWSFDAATGTLSYTLTVQDLTFSGGDLTWDTTSNGWDGSLTFEEGDIVTFQTADANVTLGEDVSASVVTIAEDCTVTLGGSHTLTVSEELTISGGLVIGEGTSISLADGATATLMDGATLELRTTSSGLSTLATETSSGSTTATLILNAGKDGAFSIGGNVPVQLTGSYPNVYTRIIVRSGVLNITSINHRYRNDITVEDGGGLWIGCSGTAIMESSSKTLTLNGDGGFTSYNNNTGRGALMVGDSEVTVTAAIAYQIALGSDSAVEVCAGSTLSCTGAVSGSGYDLDKVGTGTLTLTGNVSGIGTLTIDEGLLRYGSADSQTTTLDAGQIVVNSNGEFLMEHGGVSNTGTDIVLNGGKLTFQDCNTSEMAFGSLDIQADSTLQHVYNGSYSFTTLTGSGGLGFNGTALEAATLAFGTVKDYTGTLDVTADTLLTIQVGTIDMAAGLSGSIAGTVSSDNFLKTGEGAFTLGGLSASGVLNMNYEGSLTLGDGGLTVANGTILSYSGAGGVLHLDSIDTESVTSLQVDVYALDAEQLAAGINLGISTNISQDLLSVMGLESSAYTLTQGQDGYWSLTATQEAETDWDRNWGGTVLATAPEELPVVNNTNFSTVATTLGSGETALVLYGNDLFDGTTYTGVILQGDGNAEALVIGGSAANSTTEGTATDARDTWIRAEAGSYKAIIGGNYANNWSSGSVMAFTGDSHILIDGASVGTVMGGNYKDGQNAGFTGDTYISVLGGEVTGSMMGAGLVCHNASVTQTGDTYIFLYTALATSTSALQSEASDMVTGGFMWGTNSSGGQTLDGDTHITLDLTSYQGSHAFAKHLIGGNTNISTNSFTQTVTGDTEITVDLGESGSIASTYKVIGGSWTQGGSSVHNGSTTVNLSGGGTYGGFVTGGTYLLGEGSSTISGSTAVTVEGSMTLSDHVVGGSFLLANGTSTITGGTTLTLGGSATCSSNVVGGTYHNSAGTSSTGDIAVTLAGASVGQNLVAGSYVVSGEASLSTGDIALSISGGSVGWTTIGGLYIGGDGTASLTASTGDITLTLSGGTVHDVSGGTYSQRNSTTSGITQGAITLNLTGGTILGSVYAAGEQRGSTGITTESTTVNVGSGVTLTSGTSVNGGYMIGNDNNGTTNNSTVTGGRTLAFTDATAYANLKGVTFSNFDVVSVAAGGSVALSGITADHADTDTLAFTKTGAGTLTLSGASQSGVTVSEGTLALGSSSNTLTAVTVNDGATLDATGGTSLGGSLTLNSGATLALSGSNSSVLDLGSHALTLGGTITLNLATAWDGTSQLALITGITGEITGITFDADGYAEASSYMTGVSGKLTYSNGTLYLTTAADNLYWEATGDGNWSFSVWSATDVEPGQGSLGYTDSANVYFTNTTTGSQTVTVDQAASVTNMTISNGSYVFALSGTSSLDIKGALSVTDVGAAEFQFDLAPAGTVTVGTGSTLTVGGNATFSSLSNSGTLSVTGLATLANATAAGGSVAADSLTVTGSGDNTFSQLTVTNAVTVQGALTVGGSSSAGSLSGVTTLTVADGGSLQLTGTGATTSLATLACENGSSGTGSLNVAGSLTLTAGASQIGALTVGGTLTLSRGTNLVVNGALQAGTVSLSTLSLDSVLLDADSIGGNSLNVAVDTSQLSALGLTTGYSVTVANVGTAYNGSLTLNGGSDEVTVGGYRYIIGTDADNNIVITAKLAGGISWEGTAGETWSDGGAWEGDTAPSATGNAYFLGDGESTVTVGDTGVTVGSIVVESLTKDYTFTGGAINASSLDVRYDTLTIANATTVSGTTTVGAAGTLVVAEGGTLDAGTMTATDGSTVTNHGTLKVNGGSIASLGGSGALENTDSLSIGSDVTASSFANTGTVAMEGHALTISSDVAAGGNVTAGSVALGSHAGTFGALVADTVTAGTLTVGAGSSIGTLTADSLALAEEAAATVGSVSGGSLSSLTLNGDSALTVSTGDLSVGSLSGAGSLTLTEGALTLQAVTGSTFLSAGTINLSLTGSGNAVDTLSTDTLDFSSSMLTGKSSLAVDTVSGLTAANTTITLSGNTLEAGSYELLTGTSLNSSDFILSNDIYQAYAQAGLVASVNVTDGKLVLTVSDRAMVEIWDTEDDETTSGTDITYSGEGVYKTLDYVVQVNVNGSNATLDLRGDELENASKPADGLVVRNLIGTEGSTLTIIGKGIGEDLVTFLNTEMEIPDGTIGGSTEGGETVSLQDVTANVKAEDGYSLTIGQMTLEDAALNVDESATLTLGGLTGDAGSSLSGTIHLTGDSEYKGSYGEGTVVNIAGNTGNVTLVAGSGLTLTNASLVRTYSQSRAANEGGSVTLQYANETDVDPVINLIQLEGTSLTLENVDTDTGNIVTLRLLNDSSVTNGTLAFSVYTQDMVSGTANAITENATLDLTGTTVLINLLSSEDGSALTVNTSRTKDITLLTVADAAVTTGTLIEFDGADASLITKYYRNIHWVGGDIVADRVVDYYSSQLGGEHNVQAGAALLDNQLLYVNPQASPEASPDVAAAMDALDSYLATGDRAAADNLAAAVAGASIATLGSAFSGDVDRQLRAIRNRTTTMGVDQCQVNEDMPYFNAWVNAEGDYRKMDEDGTAAGYTLSSWGGTVGFDVDITPSFTAGLAVTAMYGDLDSKGPDSAEGDFDTYYVSLFARYVSRSWTHTFVGTVGWLDASLDRTVSYAGGSYKATGDTEGVGFGLMYEVGYVIPLNEDNTACLQPVFNVAWRHIGVDGYSESGSDAGLRADDQGMDVVTFGLGARFQSAVAENIYNRSALFEARALLKVDAGDRQSDLDVALLHGTDSANIESAETGAVGVELGAGLTIPVGAEGGALFIDGSAELRDGYTNLNGTVGYRINF